MNTAAVLLPKIVRYFGSSQSGPGEAECPHCGARGSVVHSFEVEDGRRLGAMSGCVKLFPMSPVAVEDMRLNEKERKYINGKGYALNRWDLASRNAVEDFYAGVLSEADAVRRIEQERRAASMWRKSRYCR